MSPDLSQPFDVAIAGAGLAGASLALRLARTGVRILLLDAGRFPRDKLCGEFLSPEAWGVLGRLGLDGEIARSGFHAIRSVRLSTPRGRVLEATVVGPDGRPGIGLSRLALDDRLVRGAREAGAVVLDGTRVGGPLLGAGRVVGLAARHATLGPLEVRARVTVAAEGRHSGLVRRTGTTRRRLSFRPRYFGLKRHYLAEAAEPEGTVSLHLVPGAYGGTCRVEGPRTNFCALVPERVLRRHRGDLDQLAGAVFGRNPLLSQFLRSGIPAGDWKTVSGVRVETSSPDVPGILYAGDCRGTVDPLGGQGMTMALLGAEVLAPFVLEALAEGEVGPRLLRAYERAWHRRFDRRIRLCRAFHHALIHPAAIDALSALGPLAPRLLAACFRGTRDPEPNAA